MKLRRITTGKHFVIAIALLGALLFTACNTADTVEPTDVAEQQDAPEQQDVSEQQDAAEQTTAELCVDEATGTQMTYEEAVALAGASLCSEEGPISETRTCNGTTGTWWIDLDVSEPGCAPACVIDIVDKTAEVNWRCTGALPEEASESPAPTDTPADTPDPAALLIADWAKYASLADGFAFRYPPVWTIELLTEQPISADGSTPARAVQLTQEGLQMLIEFKRPDEKAVIGPGHLATGTVEDGGTANLLGRELPQHVLVDEGKDIALFAGDRYPDIEIYAQLVVTDDGGEIPAAAQAEFGQILATFVRTGTQTEQDAYPGWATYSSSDMAPGAGFTFRHRSDWTLTETQAGTETPTGPSSAMAILQRDTHVLRIQYKHISDETTMIADDIPDSLLMEAGTVWLIGHPVPRLVVVEEERLTHIYVSYTDDALLISVDLSQDPTIVAEEEMDLSVGIRNEMDEILGSFRLMAP